MSIYRHYKGGLYFVEGYATKFSDALHDKLNATVEVVAKAKYEPTLQEIDVLIVYDSSVNSTYYSYNDENIEGVMVFYRGLDGQYWLRPKDKFHENVVVKDEEIGDTYEVPRFEKIDKEYLFDVIAEMIDK